MLAVAVVWLNSYSLKMVNYPVLAGAPTVYGYAKSLSLIMERCTKV